MCVILYIYRYNYRSINYSFLFCRLLLELERYQLYLKTVHTKSCCIKMPFPRPVSSATSTRGTPKNAHSDTHTYVHI